jgi:hypothetical protein
METWIEQLSMAICDRPAGISRSLYRDLAVVTEAEIGSKHTCAMSGRYTISPCIFAQTPAQFSCARGGTISINLSRDDVQ